MSLRGLKQAVCFPFLITFPGDKHQKSAKHMSLGSTHHTTDIDMLKALRSRKCGTYCNRDVACYAG